MSEAPLAVTFDMDGTLYDARPVRRAFALGNLFALRLVRVGLRAREELRGRCFDDGEAFFAEHARLVAERVERPVDEVRARLEELLGPRLCRALKRVGPRADARAVLEALAARGLKLALISDYATEDKIEALGLSDLPWSAQISADALGALKPNGRAFARAANLLGLPPARIMHVGDRVDTDVEAARAAGFQALLLGLPTPGVRAARRLGEVPKLL
jgi:HAD superfamily hydrolase (TIGR01549 family)